MKKESPLPKTPSHVVEIVRSDYQLSKAELEEDMSIDASFEELMQAVTEPIEIKYIPRPKSNQRSPVTALPNRFSALGDIIPKFL